MLVDINIDDTDGFVYQPNTFTELLNEYRFLDIIRYALGKGFAASYFLMNRGNEKITALRISQQ